MLKEKYDFENISICWGHLLWRCSIFETVLGCSFCRQVITYSSLVSQPDASHFVLILEKDVLIEEEVGFWLAGTKTHESAYVVR